MYSFTLTTTAAALLLPVALSAQVPPAPPTPPAAPEAMAAPASIAAPAPVAAPALVAMQVPIAPTTPAAPMTPPAPVAVPAPPSAPPASPAQQMRRPATIPLLLDVSYPQDPADGTYRAGREALNGGEYRRAAQLFAQIPQKWPRSAYAPQAYYWQAFALSRGNATTDNLRAAREALASLRSRYPDAEVRDAQALVQTINAQLAERGDVRGGAAVRRAASVVQQQGCPDPDDENDTRIVALNALLQMDAESALPILKQVLERRDACSAPLRRKAVFLISQKRSPETADLLLELVRNDPDREVREAAIFWLSQVDGARAVEALEGILRTSTDEGLQEKAIFALSQHSSERAGELLRTYALRNDAPAELRGQAIFWLGQANGAGNAQFLRDIYGRVNADEIKEKVIFSLSQHSDPQNGAFLLDIAVNEQETMEMRKQALFWAGQSQTVPLAQLTGLYDRVSNREIKDQLIFVFSQRNDRAAVDKLMSIARTDSDAELRKQAIFWLGQSSDPRVQGFLLELINGN